MRPALRAAIIGLLAMLTTACTTGRIASIWTDATDQPIRYHKLIVFGVTNSPKVRRAYEDNFVSGLREIGVKAEPGHAYVSDQALSLVVRMTEAVSKADADAIIITHLVTDEPDAQPPLPRLSRVPAHYRHLVPYFSQVYNDVCGPNYYADLEALRLETNLYDAKGERLVWSGRSEQLDPRSEQTTISDVIEETIAQMALDGYLPRASVGRPESAE
ncbi:hypothetical protein G3480_17175 [Thiorhodococcus mannitoliphagus]|uniref:DUF4136 domain-containing protein n=1 Tax=Thiorhodococcus mannitoliphagus TaxID=329406 RepID=A0A6P1DZ54_9GAMM|nr:hypothetical protein [Thiorhodococcus mannitoliphagus]NEX22016.1 hypothetical protein [Thiorhodococcus mannitoliphagus]